MLIIDLFINNTIYANIITSTLSLQYLFELYIFYRREANILLFLLIELHHNKIKVIDRYMLV